MTPHTVRARNLSPESDNKIHDDTVARQFGFTGALVPGVEVFAYATHPFAAEWGEQFLTRGRIDVEFRRPVYDGDEVSVTVADDGGFALVGPEQTPRARGRGTLVDRPAAVDVASYPTSTLATPPPPADERSLAVGTVIGTVHEPTTSPAQADYLAGIGETLPLYERFVHPGLLLRAVNAVLHRSVSMGPWIHTGSDCRFVAPARVGATLEGRGVVTERYDKNGRSWVRFDALVLADDRPVLAVDHRAIYDLGAG